jgi:hypothetical protein
MIDQIEEDRGVVPEDLPRGVSPEIAAANKDVQAIIQPRLTMLMEIADSFLLTIIEALETVPYGIRWICKQIRSLTRVSRASFTSSCFGAVRPIWMRSEDTDEMVAWVWMFSGNTQKRPTSLSARLSAASSSYASSTRPSSLLKLTCSLMGFPPSTQDARSPSYASLSHLLSALASRSGISANRCPLSSVLYHL